MKKHSIHNVFVLRRDKHYRKMHVRRSQKADHTEESITLSIPQTIENNSPFQKI